MKVEVKFVVNCSFDTEAQMFNGCVELQLPVRESDTELHSLVRNEGEGFYSVWGYYSSEEKKRYKRYFFKNSDLEELKKEIQNFINEKLQLLKKIYNENVRNLRKVKKEKEKIYIFTL